jgi:predicted RNase H-like HicB family nuclease
MHCRVDMENRTLSANCQSRSKLRSVEQKFTFTIEVHPGEEDEKGFWVSVPALPGCFSQGDTYEEAVENSREAIALYLEGPTARIKPAWVAARVASGGPG